MTIGNKQINQEYDSPPITYSTEDNKSGVIEQLNPKKEIDTLIKHLQGYVKNERTGKFEKVEGVNPLLNSEGIEVFYHYATSILSPIVTMSNYGNNYEMIHKMMNSIVKDASLHFHLYYKDYGINRKSKIKLVKYKLLFLGISAFYKAIGAGDRKAGTSNIHETVQRMMKENSMQDSVNQSKRKRFGFFGG